MDALEIIMNLLLSREGYWTTTGFKVELDKEEKKQIGRPSSPRWEIDLVAYKAPSNELLVVECKSYLDSTGVLFRNGCFEWPDRFKLFCDEQLRQVVLNRLAVQAVERGLCCPAPKITLSLAAAKIANQTDRAQMQSFFDEKAWRLFDDKWIFGRLLALADADYENEAVVLASKILARRFRSLLESKGEE